FVPQDYWTLHARFRKDADGAAAEFEANHEHGPFWAHPEAEAAFELAERAPQGLVREYIQNEREERPPPPFNTTMFVAEANRIGFGAAQAMKIAEDLYQSGYISYPRTDNTVYPSSLNLRSVLEKLQDSPFAEEARTLAVQERIVASRGRTQATDHPPIYPVQGVTREKVKRNDHWAIYELVVRRFFATVAPNAIAETAETKIDLGGQLFLAEGYRIKDPGWRKYYPYWTVREAILPALTTGESLDRVGPVTIREDRTKPPATYSEGSFIQEMERVGLGTKSTRHEILEANREAIGQEIEAALREQNYIGKCNLCKEGNLTVIRSRRGSRFLGCDRYPACRNTHPLPQIGIIQGAEENCPECGAPMIK